MATFTKSITAGTDDAHIRSDGSGGYSHTTSYVLFGKYYDIAQESYTAGMRFTGITVPKGATITAATLTVNNQYAPPGEVVKVRLYGQAADNPPTFSATTAPNTRPKTTAAVAWNVTDLPAGRVTSPDLAPIIQEVISRTGWASGNALVILAADDNSDDWAGVSMGAFEAGQAATLSITYTGDDTPAIPAPAAVRAVDTDQENIPQAWFNARAAEGVNLFITAGTPWSTAGTETVNTPRTAIREQFRMALAAGLKIGLYTRNPDHYNAGLDAAGEYITQLQFFAVDVEPDPGRPVTQEQIDGILARGVRPIVYAGSGFWASVQGSNTTAFSQYPLWDTDARDTFDVAGWKANGANLVSPPPVAYGGWNGPNYSNLRVGVQQIFDYMLDGVKVDLNSFNADFLTTKEPTPTRTVSGTAKATAKGSAVTAGRRTSSGRSAAKVSGSSASVTIRRPRGTAQASVRATSITRTVRNQAGTAAAKAAATSTVAGVRQNSRTATAKASAAATFGRLTQSTGAAAARADGSHTSATTRRPAGTANSQAAATSRTSTVRPAVRTAAASIRGASQSSTVRTATGTAPAKAAATATAGPARGQASRATATAAAASTSSKFLALLSSALAHAGADSTTRTGRASTGTALARATGAAATGLVRTRSGTATARANATGNQTTSRAPRSTAAASAAAASAHATLRTLQGSAPATAAATATTIREQAGETSGTAAAKATATATTGTRRTSKAAATARVDGTSRTAATRTSDGTASAAATAAASGVATRKSAGTATATATAAGSAGATERAPQGTAAVTAKASATETTLRALTGTAPARATATHVGEQTDLPNVTLIVGAVSGHPFTAGLAAGRTLTLEVHGHPFQTSRVEAE